MKTYHKDINFPHEKLLKVFVNVINATFKSRTYRFCNHAKERLLERVADAKYCYEFFHNINIQYADVIEYAFTGEIEKILIRLEYNQYEDIILSISKEGKIITLYFNNKYDYHKTLNRRNYART